MNLNDINVGDILVTTPGFGKKVCVVLEINPNKPKNSITFTSAGKIDGARYIAPPGDFVQKIGQVDTDSPFFDNGQNADDEKIGERHAVLSTMKAGDSIRILRCNGKTETWTFVRHLPRGRKYVFVAKNRNGTSYKFAIEQIVV